MGCKYKGYDPNNIPVGSGLAFAAFDTPLHFDVSLPNEENIELSLTIIAAKDKSDVGKIEIGGSPVEKRLQMKTFIPSGLGIKGLTNPLGVGINERGDIFGIMFRLDVFSEEAFKISYEFYFSKAIEKPE